MKLPTLPLRRLAAQIRPGTRSLKSTLALYFIPVSIVPALFISFYATRVFEQTTRESLVRRASSEHDAIIADIETEETTLMEEARRRAADPRIEAAARSRKPSALGAALANLRSGTGVRLFALDGSYVTGRSSEPTREVPYLSRDGLQRVRMRGETLDRYFLKDGVGFISIARVLLTEKRRAVGILEEEYRFGQRDLADLKSRRQVDVVFLNRELNAVVASFALSGDMLQQFTRLAFLPSNQTPYFINLGDSRFATFLYDVPWPQNKNQKWGYLAVFLSMTSADATLSGLKLAIVYFTALLVLVTTLLIFLFSNRLVKPIEMLVLAMKRVKTGRVEQIPAIDTTYEIEYLVHSFNEMTRNVAMTKRALEQRLEELRHANDEIKHAQGTLVQSAKMISLWGQLVAGVAHELNNPIGFIYSNMHHLSEYVSKIHELVEGYRRARAAIPEKSRRELEDLEKKLEIDFILNDMVDLTRSCVEGATRTKEIVLGLRTFSRMEESTFRVADLQEGIRSTAKLLTSELKDRITLHEEFGGVPYVECNPSQMNQVFMNLLSNAAQAITGKGEIWIRTRAEDGGVVVEIEDNGSGMGPEILEKIFDPFFTTKKVGQGTGLGLSIAYGLVQKHHGQIAVRSKPGQGTCFTIRLPLRQPLAQAG